MADLKISQFTNGSAIQTTDEIATNRAGVNTKVFVGSAAALDAGFGIGDVVTFQDDGSGNSQYPAADGSLITNLTINIDAEDATYTPSTSAVVTLSATNVFEAIDDLDSAVQLKIENITGLITTDSGSNILITGSGTAVDPYVLDTTGVPPATDAFASVVVREFTATGAGTYNPTTNTMAFIAEWVGAGGGGGARTTNSGTSGGSTTFDSIVANGGSAGTYGADGSVTAGGAGGTGGSGTANVRVPGGGGMVTNGQSSAGGNNPLFPTQGCTTVASGTAVNGNKGCGGGGGNSNSGTTYSGGGGGGGEYCKKAYSGTIASSYSFNIGTGGAGGTAGGIAGGAGGDGYIRITEYLKG
jgi:hypothetical protein